MKYSTETAKENVTPMSDHSKYENSKHRGKSTTNWKFSGSPVDESLKMVTPAWPLQSTVAVSPFWNYRDRHATDTFAHLERVLHSSVMMPLEYYLEKYQSGEISDSAIEESLINMSPKWPELPKEVHIFKAMTRNLESPVRYIKTLAEAASDNIDFHRYVIEDLSKYCAAYFDDKQAVTRYPWTSGSFWLGWFEAKTYDKSLNAHGFKCFEQALDLVRGQSPEDALEFMLDQIGLDSAHAKQQYLQRLLASLIGWSSQFKYTEWQESLGYKIHKNSKLSEFLSIRLIYDFAVYMQYNSTHPFQTQKWVKQMNEAAQSSGATHQSLMISYVWQLALEFTFQQQLASRLHKNQGQSLDRPEAQMIFCIDVRSETIRRHIEKQDTNIQTMGFAGFFGVPLSFKRLDEKSPGHRLPVLLPPGLHAKEVNKPSEAPPPSEQWVLSSYFRNLRKLSHSSFLYVELFGLLAVGKLFKRTYKTLLGKIKGGQVPERFDCQHNQALGDHAFTDDEAMDFSERAKGILTNLGLTQNFAKLVVFCGHGAVTTNNALQSALDCGACGGHAGDINARFLAKMLNHVKVREKLVEEGIVIPEDTRFVAAVHDTVTDSIHILDKEQVPSQFQSNLTKLQGSVSQASKSASQERTYALSNELDTNPARRSANWSEVRPEWGLSGNASFIVAPRERTKGVNLSSKSFLHDYHWQQDNNFKVLELIMTAPMVVTNWINLQYYGSVVAPKYWSSGNKLLHNLTGEKAVVEGNGGDLKQGLSLQSVHDGHKFIHDPLRLSVYIEAPQAAIEDIISAHDLVKQLIDNQWLHILQIDPDSLSVKRRVSSDIYECISE